MPEPRLPFYQDPQFHRPQTWLLLLAAVLTCLPLYVPLWTFRLPTVQSQLWVFLHRMQMSDASARLGLDIVAFLLTALVLAGVFSMLLAAGLFRDRPKQAGAIGFALIFLGVGLLGKGWQLYELATDPTGMRVLDPAITGAPGIGLWGPLVAILLLLLARRLVLRDQQRIKNMNRFWS